jgi:hypothetical protein
MDKCCQNRGTSVFPGQVSTISGYGRNGSRHGGGMNSEQALIRNMRTCRPDVKGEVAW